MVITQEKTLEIGLGPKEITIDNVQYYSHHTKELKNTQVHKAIKFVQNNCIKYAGNNSFVCEPLIGYNSRTYTIENIGNHFTCNCQGYVTKERKGKS